MSSAEERCGVELRCSNIDWNSAARQHCACRRCKPGSRHGIFKDTGEAHVTGLLFLTFLGPKNGALISPEGFGDSKSLKIDVVDVVLVTACCSKS